MAVERMRSSDNIGELAKELGVTRRCLYKWRTKLDYLEPGEEGPRPNSHESATVNFLLACACTESVSS